MNNYCRNCGKKLKENAIKCDKCNTYIVDLKVINKKKIWHIICISIVVIIVGIITSIIGYTLYYKNLGNSLYKKHLKDEFKDAQFVKYASCHSCENSCDGTCMYSPKIIGCYQYYYKSNPNITDSDIIIYYNKGNISIDKYTYLINKYGYEDQIYEVDDEVDEKYLKKRRNFLNIEVDNINSNNIDNIYEMVNEIIKIYNEDKNDFIVINIDDDTPNNNIQIENYNDHSKFEWNINYRHVLFNPSLNEVKNLYKKIEETSNSQNEENNNG